MTDTTEDWSMAHITDQEGLREYAERFMTSTTPNVPLELRDLEFWMYYLLVLGNSNWTTSEGLRLSDELYANFVQQLEAMRAAPLRMELGILARTKLRELMDRQGHDGLSVARETLAYIAPMDDVMLKAMVSAALSTYFFRRGAYNEVREAAKMAADCATIVIGNVRENLERLFKDKDANVFRPLVETANGIEGIMNQVRLVHQRVALLAGQYDEALAINHQEGMELIRRWADVLPDSGPLAQGSFFRRLADLELALYERSHALPYSGPSVKEARARAEERARTGGGLLIAGGPKLQFLAILLFTNSHCFLKDSAVPVENLGLIAGWRLAMIERAEWNAIGDDEVKRARGKDLAMRELTVGLLWPMYEEALAPSDLV